MIDNLLVKVAIVRELHYYAASNHLYQRFLPSKNTYLYPMMLLFFRLAKIRTSLRAFSISFSERLANLTFLRA